MPNRTLTIDSQVHAYERNRPERPWSGTLTGPEPEPREDADIDMLRDNYDAVLRGIEKLQYSQPERVFTDAFLQSDHPRIRRIAATWNELGLGGVVTVRAPILDSCPSA